MKKISKKQAVRNKIDELTVGAVGAQEIKRNIERQRGVMSVGRSSATEKAGNVRTPAEKAQLNLSNRQDATKGTGVTGTTTTSQMTARKAGFGTRPKVR
jgi:hypothetical protein